MAKRKTFEKLLDTELRWPRKGDTAFTKSDNSDQNARVDRDGFTRLVMMTMGYKQAGDLMIEKSKESQLDRDSLVFPIIFNYRQFIELSLKYLIAIYGPTVNIDANWKSHDLAFLWNEFQKVLEQYGTPDPDKADLYVEENVADFAKVDPGSYSYRYPVDRNGNPVPVAHDLLDLETLADVIKGVENYFTGCDGYLDGLKQATPY